MQPFNDGISPELDQRIINAVSSAGLEVPSFLYDEQHIINQIKKFDARDLQNGFQLRYAMKANPIKSILKLIDSQGVHIDACSEYEVHRAISAGIDPANIQLTGQVLPKKLKELLGLGIKICACSLHQLEEIGKIAPGSSVGIRLNPGSGSGQFPGVNVGGVFSSFGIRHEKIPAIKEIEARYDLHITTLHTHIGSGTNPDLRQKVADLSIGFSDHFDELDTINLGGGFKVARVVSENFVDIQDVGIKLTAVFAQHQKKTGKKLKLELEPGTFLLGNAGFLVSTIDDIVDTGPSGHEFVKVNIGMSDIIRPIMYGAVHPIWCLSEDGGSPPKEVIIVGHSCESSDMLTVDNRGTPLKRSVPGSIKIGDTLVIGGAGAYCSSMNCKNYNSYPEVSEYMLRIDSSIQLIKSTQDIDDMWKFEIQ